jgi:hypothetical protein
MIMLAQAQVTEPLQAALRNFATFVPKFAGFLLILLVGWLVAKAIAKAVDKVLERVGFDRAVERGGVKKALSRSQYDPSAILGKLVYYAVMLFVLQLAFGVFGPNPISDIIRSIIAFLPRIFVAIVIVVVAAAISAGVREIVSAGTGGLSYGNMLANVASGAVVAVGLFAALNQLEIAPEIVNGLFYAVLAVITGSAIIAIGGGGVMPMRQKWEQALNRAEQEAPEMREETRSTSKEDLKDRARQRQRHFESSGTSGDTSSAVRTDRGDDGRSGEQAMRDTRPPRR